MAAEYIIALAQWLWSLFFEEMRTLYGMKTQVKELQKEYRSMQGYLQGADAKRGESEVPTLTEQTRKLANDADNAIDNYTEIFEAHQGNGSWNTVMRSFNFVYHIRDIYQLVKQIREILSDWREVKEDFDRIGVRRTSESWTPRPFGSDTNRRLRSYPIQELDEQHVSNEVGQELFSRLALSKHPLTGGNLEHYKSLAKEMLDRSDGLRSTIIALACILNTKDDISEWQHVKKALLSKVMNGTRINMNVMIEMLYDDLPYVLKQCFLYLGLFPNGCPIPTGMLARMWIAEGLVTADEEMSQEDVAAQYLQDLSNFFMVQIVKTNVKGEIKVVCLHNLFHQLCLQKSKEQRFLQVYTPLNDLTTTSGTSRLIEPHRAALHTLHSSDSIPTQVSKLRSLVLLARSSIAPSAYGEKQPLDLGIVPQKFKFLKLLSVWGVKTRTRSLPVEIGSLLHLRYLEIRATNITELPKSISKLRNLLTLDYRNVDLDGDVQVNFFSSLLELRKLRHLLLPVECPWKVEDQLQLSPMTNLRTLWGVKENAGGVWLSREVPKLSKTLKKLRIEVSTESDLKAAFTCPSLVSDELETFHLELKGRVSLRNIDTDMAHPLFKCNHLLKLILIGKVKIELSLLLPKNLVMLELKDNKLQGQRGVRSIEVLGAMTNLKRLRLSNAYEETILTFKSSSFPRLEQLYLDNFQTLQTWNVERGSLPCLKQLEIKACRQLEEFPDGLNFVKTLEQLDSFEMPATFHQKATEFLERLGNSGNNSTGTRVLIREGNHSDVDHPLTQPGNGPEGTASTSELIIRDAVIPVDRSSIHQQLTCTAGILLNDRKQKYWITRNEVGYNNCFVLYARDLTMGDRLEAWQWTKINDSDDNQIEIAETKTVYWLDCKGIFDTYKLSPNVTYEVAYVIMLKTQPVEFSPKRIKCILRVPGEPTQENLKNLDDQPKDQWIRVRVGEFENNPERMSGVIRFYLEAAENGTNKRMKPGFAIKGVVIEPKQL